MTLLMFKTLNIKFNPITHSLKNKIAESKELLNSHNITLKNEIQSQKFNKSGFLK